MRENVSLYLHIPFCQHRCSYCDFNTYAGMDHLRGAYVDALCWEMNLVAEGAGLRLPIRTIFFGGGTPSLLSSEELRRILDQAREVFVVKTDAEISLEANPGTLTPDSLKAMHDLGINRISMGMQSAHPDDLRLLERQHDFLDVVESVKWARQAGFTNLSVDLIFGLPEQPLARWQDTLERALDLGTEHLSLYALTLEHRTPFQHWTEKGLVPEADNDLAADMYEYASERLARAGLRQYEISNWARIDAARGLMACQHNLQYWRNLPYIGIGAGAHGYIRGSRTANVLGISAYIQRVESGRRFQFPQTPATVNLTPIDRWTEMEETMMVGLRLTQEGVDRDVFERRFGRSMEAVFAEEISDCLGSGLVEWAGERSHRLRLTERGHLLGNQVFMRFVGKETPGA
ncbi:MAG TPA: radical SAM family heme chaperone HemW [Anaerolineaceae bacterium]|nr:radical SAM family heme chaperone HemW [Anaerolineaceae bacterium]